MFTDYRCFAVIVSIISVTGVLFSGHWSTANVSEEVIRSKQSTKTKSCQIPLAPNTIYFQKELGNNKQILTPNTAVDGNAEVVHIECADGASTTWQGEHYMVCYDGQWYPPNNVCIKLCPAWSLLNSELSCTLNNEAVSCEKNIRAGTVANRTCKLGYVEQSNAPLSICKDDGEWSQNYLDCFTDCGEIDHHYQSNDTQYDTSVAFPWKAGLYKKKSDSDDFEFICGATLVETQYLLTAARCVTDSNGTLISGDLLRVGLGKSYMKWNDPRDIHAQNLEVLRATDGEVHAKLVGDKASELNKSLEFLEPLSKIYLERRIDLSSFVRPICTVTRKRFTLGLKYTLGVMEYVNGTIFGWDRDGNHLSFTIRLYTNEHCRALISNLTKRDAELENEMTKFGRFCTDITGVFFTGSWPSTDRSNKEVIKSKQRTTTKSCRIPSAPNTIYFEKKSESEKGNLKPNSVVDGNGAVVHIECGDGARESTSWQGEHYMVCYDGQWYPPNNFCIKLCPGLLSPPNSVLKCTLNNEPVSCEMNIQPHTLVTRTCKSGFIDTSKASLDMCRDDGKWNYEFVDCFVDCGSEDRQYQSNNTEHDNLVASPWEAGIYMRKNHSEDFEFICSAMLIEPKFIITAASCVKDSNGSLLSSELLRVGLGKSYMLWNDTRDTHAQKFNVLRVTDKNVHAQLTGGQVEKLRKPLDFLEPVSFVSLQGRIDPTSFVRPVCAVFRKRFKLRWLRSGSQFEYLNGTIIGWDHDGNHISYPIKLYTNEYCRNLISNLGIHDAELEKEMLKLGRFCTDRALPDSLIGSSSIYYDEGAYTLIGVLIGIYDSMSVFQGVIDKEAAQAAIDFYDNFMSIVAKKRFNP